MNKISILLLVACFSSAVYAQRVVKTVARVTNVKGNAFVFNGNSGPSSLKYGSRISDLSEVMVEDGSALSLINNEGHEYHLNGGTLVKFFNGLAELKSGQAWVVVKSSYSRGKLNTVNSIVNYGEGEFIYSFDNISGKTQLLVLTGDAKFSNILEPDLYIDVNAGHFSLIGQDYENGLPRTPTKVGLKSYKKFKQLFSMFDNLQNTTIDKIFDPNKKKARRKIASVQDQFSPVVNNSHSSNRATGKVIKIKTYRGGRIPASTSPMSYYKSMYKSKNKRIKHQIKPKYFGFSWSKKTTSYTPKKTKILKTKVLSSKKLPKVHTNEVKRIPASIEKKSLIKELSMPKSNFEKSLEKSMKTQKRHPSEVNNLIDELKSFKQDYKKEY